ncbi:phosphatase PAP2 family protein, partial [Porcincola intestinalis]
NRLDLRPAQVEGNDIFAILCRYLYRTDTPTNVLPSIHVYNSMAVCYAVNANETLRRKKWVIAGTDVLTLLIVLSTMFLKQHSVIDVTTGMVMSVVLQVICDHIFETEPERAGADARIYSSKQGESGSRA